VPNRGAVAVLLAIADAEKRLHFSVISADYDNGSEILNSDMGQYWRNRFRPVQFVRSRPYRKKAQGYVEQKNFTYVLALFGYDRMSGRRHAETMSRIYREVRGPLHNFSLPSEKPLTDVRNGSRYVKKYDRTPAPYQRLLGSADLSKETKMALELNYLCLNPFKLRQDLELELELKGFFDGLREDSHPLKVAV